MEELDPTTVVGSSGEECGNEKVPDKDLGEADHIVYTTPEPTSQESTE